MREEIAVRLDAEPQALEWIDCMAGTGLLPEVLSTEAPFHALADEVGLVLLPSTGLAGIDDHEHGDVIESAQFIERENRYVLDEEALNDALAKVYDLESELFRADKQCAESSGLADSAVRIREDVEATVLAELGSE